MTYSPDTVEMLYGLTPEEQIFVSAYSNCLNLTKAYLEVSPNVKTESAAWLGLRMYQRPHVKQAICEYIAQRKAALDLDGKLLVHSLLQVAGANIADFMDDDGDISLAKVKAAAPELQRCVAEAEQSHDPRTGVTKQKLKMKDSLRAIELVGKYLKLWTDKMELGGEGGGPVGIEVKFVDDKAKP